MRQVAWYASTSHVFLDHPTGVTIAATVQNEAQTTVPKVAIGDEL